MTSLWADLLDEVAPPPRYSRWRCDRPGPATRLEWEQRIGCDGDGHDRWPHNHARPEQLPPPGDWRTWYLQGGRGSGKTRPGAETLAEWAWDMPGDWAVVAPTFGVAKDVCVEGPSGLLQALGHRSADDRVANWNRSLGELRLTNGSVVYIDGGDDGATGIQGKNLRGAWCDEVGLWKRWDLAWNESIAFAVRLAPARIVATGTPKAGHGLVKLLVDDPAVPKSRLRTRDNYPNLAPGVVADFEARYAGTRRARQELEGEFLDDVPGALWTAELIERDRLASRDHLPALLRVVVGVDPQGTNTNGTSQTGIVVVGKAADGHDYVLDDATVSDSPAGWAKAVVAAYDRNKADRVIAERNFGADMVEHTLRTERITLPLKTVTASLGKRPRAEPVSALYEQGRVHHAGTFPELEAQMCTYVPGERSPDRMDALVWAIHELNPGLGLGAVTQSHWVDRRLAGSR